MKKAINTGKIFSLKYGFEIPPGKDSFQKTKILPWLDLNSKFQWKFFPKLLVFCSINWATELMKRMIWFRLAYSWNINKNQKELSVQFFCPIPCEFPLFLNLSILFLHHYFMGKRNFSDFFIHSLQLWIKFCH